MGALAAGLLGDFPPFLRGNKLTCSEISISLWSAGVREIVQDWFVTVLGVDFIM